MNLILCSKKSDRTEAIRIGGDGVTSDVAQWLEANGALIYSNNSGSFNWESGGEVVYPRFGDYVVATRFGGPHLLSEDEFQEHYDIHDSGVSDRISESNLEMIRQEYDSGLPNKPFRLDPLTGDPDWVVGVWDGTPIYWAVQKNGLLFSVVLYGTHSASVCEGQDLLSPRYGTMFNSVPEAIAYVRGLTAK